MGALFIVATPIGNMKDITLRAIETLQNVTIIACEDTRRTGLLLQKISELTGRTTNARLVSYYEENEAKRIPEIVELLTLGENIALVSDAGTPAVSDPGFKLIREAIRIGAKVEAIPGASSVTAALVSSGLPTDKFLFLGFLPHKEGHRTTLLENVKKQLELVTSTIIFFEAPHRLVKTLSELEKMFGDIEIVIARELTKLHEEVRREKISEARAHFTKNQPRGEIVILFHPQL